MKKENDCREVVSRKVLQTTNAKLCVSWDRLLFQQLSHPLLGGPTPLHSDWLGKSKLCLCVSLSLSVCMCVSVSVFVSECLCICVRPLCEVWVSWPHSLMKCWLRGFQAVCTQIPNENFPPQPQIRELHRESFTETHQSHPNQNT